MRRLFIINKNFSYLQEWMDFHLRGPHTLPGDVIIHYFSSFQPFVCPLDQTFGIIVN